MKSTKKKKKPDKRATHQSTQFPAVEAVRNPCASCHSLSLALAQHALALKLEEKEQYITRASNK